MKLILSDKPIPEIRVDGRQTHYFDLSTMKISPCVGCYGCWTRTPGKCVIRDDATHGISTYRPERQGTYITRVRYGCYDSVMKRMLETAIPVQQAFIRIHNGETHHVQRAVVPKQATIIAYGDLTDEEKDIFSKLVSRNSQNMNFASFRIIFTTEAQLGESVKKILDEWEQH